jgi:DNA-binding transcriptional MocR family regulator
VKSWAPVLQGREGPKYLAIADALAADVAAGRLAPGDRLPPQRDLAGRLALDFTTVARGYVEAGKRGLVECVVGRGTFVRRHASVRGDSGPQRSRADFMMNMPPEPDDPELLQRMRAGFASVAADLDSLLRYQGFGGSPMDRDAAASWLGRRALVPSQEWIFLAPSAHGAMVGIFSLLARAGDTVLCEAITYPDVRSICAQLGLQLIGVDMDGDGIIPEALEEAMRRHAPKAIYLNPTLQNPMTITIPERRRTAICSLAHRLQIPIVEDDPMGSSRRMPPRPSRPSRPTSAGILRASPNASALACVWLMSSRQTPQPHGRSTAQFARSASWRRQSRRRSRRGESTTAPPTRSCDSSDRKASSESALRRRPWSRARTSPIR